VLPIEFQQESKVLELIKFSLHENESRKLFCCLSIHSQDLGAQSKLVGLQKSHEGHLGKTVWILGKRQIQDCLL